MAPPTRTPRSTWVDAGLRALADGGPDAVRIEPLAKALGVTRGGFYGHFENRGALLDALVDSWEQAAIDEVLEQVESSGGDPRTKIRRAGALTFSETLLPIELAVRDWSRRDAAVAERLKRVDNRRMSYLRSLFASFCADDAEIEGRSVLAFSLAIGIHFMAADHGAYDRAEAIELAVQQLLR
jgi:AcrR family transcriptional regulator